MDFATWAEPLSLKLECVRAFENPMIDDEPLDRHSVRIASGQTIRVSRTHWQCKLSCGERSMVFYFSQGSAHHDKATGQPLKPKLEDVLNCLASESVDVENAKDFEDWASEYGYDLDSRKAERTYRARVEQARELNRVLGEAAYNTLLYEVERL